MYFGIKTVKTHIFPIKNLPAIRGSGEVLRYDIVLFHQRVVGAEALESGAVQLFAVVGMSH